MVFPLNNDTDPYHSFTYYQAIIATEIMVTLIIFFVLVSSKFLVGVDELLSFGFTYSLCGSG